MTLGESLLLGAQEWWSGEQPDGSYRDVMHSPIWSIPTGVAMFAAGAIGLLMTLALGFAFLMFIGACWVILGYRSYLISGNLRRHEAERGYVVD